MVLLGLTLVALVFVVRNFVVPEISNGEPATAPLRTSNPQVRQTAGTPNAASQLPEPLKLTSLEPVPDAPEVGRNPFAFGALPKPPIAAPPPQVYQPPAPPPPPPWPPPIGLKLVTIVDGPDGRRQASLKDPVSGTTFLAPEGAIVDGRYKVLKVAQTSVVVSYVDGSGQRVLTFGG
ncbi:MAG TPA: hypothetical protein VES67_14585 [Vicinamibacterales bacterium]|nr:hypothetical protein [Vicinamibacterales bacterium]